MLTFKSPLRKRPFTCEIAPNGNLMIAHAEHAQRQLHMNVPEERGPYFLKVYEHVGSGGAIGDNGEWELHYVDNIPEDHISFCKRYPLHVLVNDAMKEPTRGWSHHKKFVEIAVEWENNKNVLNMGNGRFKTRSRPGERQNHIEFEATSFGMIMREWLDSTQFGVYTSVRQNHIEFEATSFGMIMREWLDSTQFGVYTSVFDWNKFNSLTVLKFKHFHYIHNRKIIFHANPKRCISICCDITYRANPKRCDPTYNESTLLVSQNKMFKPIIEFPLELPRSKTWNVWHTLCGIPVNDNLTVTLLGKEAGEMLRFYYDGKYHHDFKLPHPAFTILLSPDQLTLTVVGVNQITKIDLDT